ncbi:hypothetical protein C2S53_000202 [Perilla frutescens var. hirtella]|uniref:Uncharacterized protein n=1 Tax=Perilla frutescens var. hirtella TaxID=608512 RepID=A0AAD4JAI5_PERFH|nr:hypothetical protein C2S53_000202 [Perilla frutescens var. hirtella]
MAAGRVAVLTVMWVALAALAAAADAQVAAPAPAPAPTSAATGGMPSNQIVFLGIVAAAVSFSSIKELI